MMEAAKEDIDLLDKVLPPRLEDAGLEDCALPPDCIQEAFRKAANAVKSRAAEEEKKTPSAGAPEAIVAGGGEGGRSCGDGLKGLDVEGDSKDGTEEEEEKPMSVEGFA